VPLTLGTEPDRLDLILVPGADFVETVETMNAELTGPQPWPLGTVLSLRFTRSGSPAVDWVAVIDTNLVSWNVQSPQVDAVVNAGYRQVGLWYENGPVRTLLALGEVNVHG
jgi:hypothetical protein